MRDDINFPFGTDIVVRPGDSITKGDLTSATTVSLGTFYLPRTLNNNGAVAATPTSPFDAFGFDVIALGFNLTVGDTPDVGHVTLAGQLGLYVLYGATPTALAVTSLYGVPITSVANTPEGFNTGFYYPPASEFAGYPAAPTTPTLPTYSAAVAAQTNWPGYQVEQNMDLTAFNNLTYQYQPVYPKIPPTVTVASVVYPVHAIQWRPAVQGTSDDAGHQFIFPYAVLRRRRTV